MSLGLSASSTSALLGSAVIVPLSDANICTDVRLSPGPILIGAYAPGCPSSSAMTDTFARLAWAYTRLVKFCSLNVAEAPGAAFQLGIRRAPAVVYVMDGAPAGYANCFSDECLRRLMGIRTDWTPFRPQSALLEVAGPRTELTRPRVRFDGEIRLGDQRLVFPDAK